jgi:hypothetical protein
MGDGSPTGHLSDTPDSSYYFRDCTLVSQLRHAVNDGELRHFNSRINVEQMSTIQSFRRIVFPDSNNLLHRRSTRMAGFFESLHI